MKTYEKIRFEEWLIDESNPIIFCCTDDPFMDESSDDGCINDESIGHDDDSFESTLQKLLVSDEGMASAHIRAFWLDLM